MAMTHTNHSTSGLVAALLAIVLATSILADNGEVAYSRPVEGLVIDGNADDWPDDAQPYPIDRKWKEDLDVSSDDFSATFKSGFNSQKKEIYFLVEVHDESHVVDRQLDGEHQERWQFFDTCILYLDTQHSPKGSGAQIFLNFGNQRTTIGKENAWDPATKSATWNNVELAVQRKENLTTYEWKFKNCQNVEVGKTIGLDFLICDADRGDDSEGSIHLWGPGDGKSHGAGSLGDLVLVSADAKLFNVAGRFEWKGRAAALKAGSEGEGELSHNKQPIPNRAHLFSDSKLVATLAVEESGSFNAKLPKGEYGISLSNEIAEDVTDEESRRIRIVDRPVISAGNESQGTATVVTLEFEGMPYFHAASSPLFDYSPQCDSKLVKVVESYRDYYDVPGYSMALVRDGKLVFSHAAGQSNRFTGKLVDENTLFEAASITKAVFAFAVNRLAEQGEIDLDKPLGEYLEFAELSHDPRARKITARHCLNHSSGLPNWFWEDGDGKVEMLFEPGEKHGYSGEAMMYLGRVVEHLQDKPLEQVVLDEACRPLGFTESVFFSDCEALRSVASFGHVNKMPQAHDNSPMIGVASTMFTESKAFSKFMISLMNRAVLSDETYKEMFRLSMSAGNDGDEGFSSGFGLGFQIAESKHGKVIKHSGNNGDFQCLFEIYDESNDGFVIFANSDTGGDFIVAVRDYLLEGEVGDRESGDTSKSKPRRLTAAELDAKLVEIERQAVLPGFAVSIFDKDKVIYEKGYGYADIENKRPFTSDSVQYLASISKTVVATAMMQAVERGELSLDDPVNDHLPFKVVHPKFPKVPISVRHLATHTSSIGDGSKFEKTYLFREKLIEADFPKVWHEHLETYNTNQPLGFEEYLGKALSVEGGWNDGSSFLQHKPGTAYEYSNSGIGLLGLAIQRATGKEFRELTQNEIFKPIGMESTTWHLDQVDPKQHVVYYNELLNPVPRYTFSTYPDGGVFSSVSDLRKFAQEMMKARLGESKLLKQKSAVEMMTQSGLNLELPVALVWDIEMGEGELIGHAGNDFGTSTYMYFNPNTGIGRIFFANVSMDGPIESACNEIYNSTFRLKPAK